MNIILEMDSSISSNDDEHIESHLSKTQSLELAYQETVRNTDLIIKDESARRLRLRILMLENENNELHDQLSAGDDRLDVLEQESEELRNQLINAQEEVAEQESQMRAQARELSTVKAELKSMNGVSSDSAKLLTEKLSLARELAILKPELEHLRSQTTFQQTVLAEKLALERQVSTLEVELEAEKRASKRAIKKNNSHEREAELQTQVDELKRELVQEKRDNINARKEAEVEFKSQIEELEKELDRERRDKKKARDGMEKSLQKEVEDLQRDLARGKRDGEKSRAELEADLRAQLEELQEKLVREKRESSKARKNLNTDLYEQVESLQQDLAREKKESEKIRKEVERARKNVDSELQDRLESIEQDLVREKKESQKARKEAEKDKKAMESQQAILESKVDQLRTKLRSTKEELKESQADLSKSKTEATKQSRSAQLGVPTKNSRKRGASEMDVDIAIGTPDGGAVRGKRQMSKKGRAEPTMVGEKSMFSITPFLNRTMSMAPDTPGEEEDSDDDMPQSVTRNDEAAMGNQIAVASLTSNDASPIPASNSKGRKKATTKPKASGRPVLAEAKSNLKTKKSSPKPARAASKLEIVTEEEDDDENVQPNEAIPPMKISTANDISKPTLQTSKLTKSAVADDVGAKKKKRKLLGEGKTLFDEEDGETTKRPSKVNLGVPRLLGKGGLAGPKGGLRGGLGGSGNFGAFSPLKKDRRGIGASFLG